MSPCSGVNRSPYTLYAVVTSEYCSAITLPTPRAGNGPEAFSSLAIFLPAAIAASRVARPFPISPTAERGLHGALAALCTSKYFQNPKMRPAEPLDPTFRFSGGIQFVPVLLICLYGGWYAGNTGKSGSLLNPGLYSATFRRQTLEEKVCFT